MSDNIQVDELFLERVRGDILFMNMTIPVHSKEEQEIRQALVKDFMDLYESRSYKTQPGIKVIKK